MLEVNIKVTGVSEEEVVMAIGEAVRKFTSGINFANDKREDDTGSYSLEVSGFEEEHIYCPHCGCTVFEINEKLPEICPNCGEEINLEEGD